MFGNPCLAEVAPQTPTSAPANRPLIPPGLIRRRKRPDRSRCIGLGSWGTGRGGTSAKTQGEQTEMMQQTRRLVLVSNPLGCDIDTVDHDFKLSLPVQHVGKGCRCDLANVEKGDQTMSTESSPQVGDSFQCASEDQPQLQPMRPTASRPHLDRLTSTVRAGGSSVRRLRAGRSLRSGLERLAAERALRSGRVTANGFARFQRTYTNFKGRGATASLLTLPNEDTEDWWKHSGTPECVPAIFLYRKELMSSLRLTHVQQYK